MRHDLAGKRILIVEEDPLTATNLRRALTAEDAEVVGPVACREEGLALAAQEHLDGAVLDVVAGDDRVFDIADRLAGRAIPYMFFTVRDRLALPEAYRGNLRISKPATIPHVLMGLSAICCF